MKLAFLTIAYLAPKFHFSKGFFDKKDAAAAAPF
jgi:hypothetical protein